MKPDTLITFEHPVNEQVRLYLRLESLFAEFKKHLADESPESSKYALAALLKILNVADRPDLKSKLVQTLTQHMSHLKHLGQSPEVDSHVLQEVLQSLDQHIHYLHEHKGKLGDDLRKHEFLNQIRMHITNPTGVCENTLPPLRLWLARSADDRQYDLELWSKSISKVLHAVSLLLKLIRQSTQTLKLIAHQGFYQQNLDPSQSCELLRISIAASLDLFPEFSANKHRFMIRFLSPDLYEGRKPTQTKADIEFYLRACRI